MMKVFKIGGNVIENPGMMDRFCRNFAVIGGPKVLVHGGGVLATRLQESLGQTARMHKGRRITDEDALKAVTMTYAGWCNKMLTATLQKYGCNAIGLAGCDANVIRARKRPPKAMDGEDEVIDYGFVGDVFPEDINAGFLESLAEMGITPVLCAINHDGNGQLLNTNADTIASCVASVLRAELFCCFELDGVLADKDDPSSIIERISAEDFEKMKKDGTIQGGMIPKISGCLDALRNGASGAIIKNATRIGDDSGTRIVL